MSNKKTLLNEGTIRRFMTLANMDNLAESYLDRYEVNEGEEEEEVEEGMRPAKDDKEVEEGMRAAKEEDEVEEGMRGLAKDDENEPAMRDLDEEELDLDAEAEIDAPEEAPADQGGADEAMVKKLVDAIAGAIEQETGVEVAVEGGDEEPEMDLGAPEEEGGEELEADALELDDETAKHDGPVMEDEDFDAYIAEVTRRVAKRIIKKKISK